MKSNSRLEKKRKDRHTTDKGTPRSNMAKKRAAGPFPQRELKPGSRRKGFLRGKEKRGKKRNFSHIS